MSKLSKHQIREDHIHDVLAEGFGNLLLGLRDGWKLYAGVAGAILVVALGAVYFWSTRSSKEEKASTVLAKVQAAYDAQIAPTGGVSDEDNPTFPSEEARRKEVEKLVGEIEAKGAGAPARIALIYSALEAAKAGKPDQALTVLQPLVGDSELAPVALRVRGKIYEGQGQWDKAEADWKAYADLKNPTVPAGQGQYLLGQYYERRAQKEKALEAYDRALATLSEAPDDSPLKSRIKTQVTSLKGGA